MYNRRRYRSVSRPTTGRAECVGGGVHPPPRPTISRSCWSRSPRVGESVTQPPPPPPSSRGDVTSRRSVNVTRQQSTPTTTVGRRAGVAAVGRVGGGGVAVYIIIIIMIISSDLQLCGGGVHTKCRFVRGRPAGGARARVSRRRTRRG